MLINRCIYRRDIPLYVFTLRKCRFSTTAKSFSRNGSDVPQRQISKIVIANRGEIACRIMKTAKKMGVSTVAVFSDPDRNSLHVRLADEAYHIGAAASQESYLKKEKILDVAKRSGAQAIHPGYGFLSENAEFAEMCQGADVEFIGPPPNAIRDMGLKNTAKSIMSSAGVPIITGYHGSDQSDKKLKEEAHRIGYPVMLKAVRGGGGKGMRIVLRENDFDAQLESARREATKSFGNDDMIVEKFVVNPRHVEVQVFGDKHKNYVYLFERDCSVQRRHQKIIEEAPAPGISEETRKNIGVAAVKAAQAVGYFGAGTVEFIMDTEQKFFFMEMNTRLQVEHPISEMITGFDFVEWQLKVARGEPLPVVDQEKIKLNGHSFEARIYAEDPDNNFMPAAGFLHHLDTSQLQGKMDVRVETGVLEGDQVSVHYDPMIAKLVVWAPDRFSALRKLDENLSKYHIAGAKTNVDFLRRLAAHVEFQRGNVYTDFIKDYGKDLFTENYKKVDEKSERFHSMIGGMILLDRKSEICSSDPFSIADEFRMNLPSKRRIIFSVEEKDEIKRECEVFFENEKEGKYAVKTATTDFSKFRLFDVKNRSTKTADAVEFNLEFDGKITRQKVVAMKKMDEDGKRHLKLFSQDGGYDFFVPAPKFFASTKVGGGAGDSGSTAPMPGVIEKILVAPGQQVRDGDPLIVMVAMKMEYTIKAPHSGLVEKVLCTVGDNVPKGAHLVSFKEEKTAAKNSAEE